MKNKEHEVAAIEEKSSEKFDYLWILNCSLVTAIAVFLRFYWLELKPLHHDEGVNGYFLKTLFDDGVYKYDPSNYHGPDLYYLALAFSKTFGLNTLSVRSSTAIFGVLTVFVAFFLRKYIGKIGSIAAALFIALSPGMVYISRYFIHEIIFVFFSLALVVSILYFIEGRKAGVFAVVSMTLLLLVCFSPSVFNLSGLVAPLIKIKSENAILLLRLGFFLVESVLVFFVMRMLMSWNEGRPIYLLLASACAVLLCATKETAFITVGTMLIACVCVWLWRKMNATRSFERVASGIFLFGTIILAVAALIDRKDFYEGAKPILDIFRNAPNMGFVLYAFVALAAVSLVTWFLILFKGRKGIEAETKPLEKVELTWSRFRAALGNSTDLLLILIAALVVFIYVGVLFFSSFFTNPEGVADWFKAYAVWTKAGTKDHTQNGMLAYLKWGMKVESPILILSAIGTLIALIKARHRFAIFAAFWAFGMFAAYTIIPYKTPWLALSFILPMCIIAGYGVGEMLRARDIVLKVLGGLIAILATGVLGVQSYDLNFVRYDNEDMAYVYAHTKRGFHDLIKQIEHYGEKSGKGKEVTVEVVSPDYWSMPWYMNDYPKVGFHGQFVDANTAEMVVIKKDDQDVEAIERYASHYKYVGTYPLRPGVELRLLVRKDLADPTARDMFLMEGAEALTVTPDDSEIEEEGTKTR